MAGPELAFVHTAAVHVATFDALVKAQAPGLNVRHVVDDSLLADAQRLGINDPGLRDRVHQTLRNAADGAVRQVLCTCTTIGRLAESTPTDGRFEVLRVDRAMAERAVERGPRVQVVVALASTVEATRALLLETAARQQRPVRIDVTLVEGAWPHFLQGDLQAYHGAVAAAARTAAAQADVVVLAQASMAGALPLLADLAVEVLSSPVLGVARAVERWRLGAA